MVKDVFGALSNGIRNKVRLKTVLGFSQQILMVGSGLN